jgi:hypothetical protein
MMVLPHLTDEPDAVLAELAGQVPDWPERPAAEQFAAFLDLLRVRFGRQAVIERSGYSLHWIPRLREAFPEARFVHLHRSGPDCAVSMSRHVGYRFLEAIHEIYELLGISALAELTEEHIAALPPELAALLGDQYDASLILERDVPLRRFGDLWSQLVTEGVTHLSAVPRGQRMTLAYDDLLDAPDRALARLATFAGVTPDPTWLTAARPLIDPTRRHPASALTPSERVTLEAACAPGARALAGG